MKQNFETTIQDVTVYPDRARVMRVGSAEITQSTNQLHIDNLPLSLNVDSLRVGGRGTARVRILGVDVQQQHYRETPAERVRDLQAEIETITADMQAIKDDKQSLQTQLTYLKGLTEQTEQFARGLALRRTDVESQAALLDFVQQRDSAARSQLRALDGRHHEANKSLAQAQAQLKQLQSQQQTKRYRAVVDVEVVGDGEFSAEITYVVNRAGWQPLYDVRLDETSNKITLTALAQVSQKSGEDWQGVGLTFSTARPALNQRLPKLRPIYVDEQAPAAFAMAGAVPQAAAPDMAVRSRKQAAKPRAMAAPAPVAEAETVMATVESGGAAVSFRAAGSIDVPGDGSTRKTTLAEYPLDPKIDYVSIPRHTDSVFRRATIVNTSDAPLLKGGMNLFVGGEFIGRNQLPFTARGDEIELLLGVEERVTVERELLKRSVDKRMLRDKRVTRYGYKIAVKNLLDAAVNVTVEDQIPVSRHESIKVNMESIKPQPSEHSALNLVKWQLPIRPQAESTITYEYTVEHPRDMDVNGME